ncbi:DUF3139 domain-containing protein [Sporolactobacillus shoreae]|uniref:DUF3139 domain-containing protein n=1 Tax=Sporolactobacillus shoreae TaxID=1465501 RepID=A0A4Z0GQP2_9BACL|nr:DUF3139 domain-containing protein [Sporolactobacillus shoreae]TGA98353.1 DUF3139 domain-containing protein [Sporolactobacillus shoreae]
MISIKKKRKVIILTVLIVIIASGLFASHFYWAHKRDVAWAAINQYIEKQGIKKSDIKVSSFFTQDDGQYHRFIYVQGEKPNIAYEYIYKAEIRQVYFTAEYIDRKLILKHEWGGAGLLDSEMNTLKYAPLKNSYGYGSKYDVTP